MKKPHFWDIKQSWQSTVLAPLGWLYAYSVRRRLRHAQPYQPKIPVICVGNITVGGTGKTPVCLALAKWCAAQGRAVVFLNHGYHSRRQNVLVNVKKDTVQDVSDEALLLARCAPTVVDKNRGRGAALAEKTGADLIIMDDGFQNPSVIKTLSLLVFDGRKGIGNGKCLPAGPLREPLAQGLKRADAVVIVGTDKTGLTEQVRCIAPDMPILTGALKSRKIKELKGRRVMAFAGIGSPDKFFQMLQNEGVVLEKTVAFCDHHVYTPREIKELVGYKGPILTTTKDAVKMPPDALQKMTVVSAPFVFDDKESWNAFLRKEML